jgi:outer membrane protein TolC
MKHLLSLSVVFFCASQVHGLTYEEAVKSASENSHELKITRLEVASASFSETKAFAGFLPKLELEGRHLFSERFQELEVPFGGNTFSMPAIQPYSLLGVTASVNIFNGLRTTYDLQAARLEKDAAEFRLKRSQELKAAEIRTLFYRALGSQVLVQVADQNTASLERHLKDVNVRFRSGVSTRYDSLRIEVQLEDARTEKVAAENGVVIARAKLFEALGLPDDGTPLEGKLPDDFTKVDLNKALLTPESRMDRAALMANRERLESLAKGSRAHWMPSVALFGSYEWYNNINHSITESDERFKSDYALGVKFNWNLYDGGADVASQQQASLAHQMAEENVSKFDQNMQVALEEAKRRFSYDVISYNAKLSSIRKAEEAVRLAQGGLRAGTRTSAEILDAVMDLNRARAAAIKSQVDAIEALGQLEVSLGHSL